MKKKIKPVSENAEIVIPEDQIEVVEVAPENIHIESSSTNSNRSSGFQSKTFSFKTYGPSGPVKLTPGKFFLGCGLFLLLLLGVFLSFLIGITKLIQKLFSFFFN